MKQTITYLPVEALSTAKYNRKIDSSQVRKIAGKFNNNLLGTLLVSYRDGNYYIVDGQHRAVAMKLIGAKKAPCEVLFGMSYEDEAQLFYDINVRAVQRPLTALEEVNGLFEAGDDEIREMFDVIESHGYEISRQVGENKIACVSAVKRTTQRYGTHALNNVLTIIKAAWGGDQNALKAQMVDGIAYLLNVYKSEIDTSRLSSKLKRISPIKILAGADADPSGGAKKTRVARQILKQYNRNLSPSNKVSDWL